ncbi:pheA gene leader peptide protein [Escherichia coli K-12]|nr:pheA gene leader peptide protein [Escherichia coli K-12]
MRRRTIRPPKSGGLFY